MHCNGNAGNNLFFFGIKGVIHSYTFNECQSHFKFSKMKKRNEYIVKDKWCLRRQSTQPIIYHILVYTFICFYISSKSMPMQQKSTSQYVKEELRNICNARSEKHLQQQQQQQHGMSQGLPPPPVSQTMPSTPQPPTSVEYSELPNYIIEQSKFCSQIGTVDI